MDQGRLEYQKKSNYNIKVLLGNWFEDTCSYKKGQPKYLTTSQNAYQPKPFSANDPAFLWDQKFKSEGLGPRLMSDHDGFNYLDNWSSTYDLAYNHYTKISKGPIPRKMRSRFDRYEPEKDFAKNHGPVTTFGLREFQKEKWRCEISDPRLSYTTSYEDTFKPPVKEYYLFRHWAIPLPNSSILIKANLTGAALNLRTKPLCIAADNDKLVPFPPELPCNPITWECPRVPEKNLRRCIPPRKIK